VPWAHSSPPWSATVSSSRFANGWPSSVMSGVAYVGTDFGREALAVPGQPE
jgi:hypothetical protein